MSAASKMYAPDGCNTLPFNSVCLGSKNVCSLKIMESVAALVFEFHTLKSVGESGSVVELFVVSQHIHLLVQNIASLH